MTLYTQSAHSCHFKKEHLNKLQIFGGAMELWKRVETEIDLISDNTRVANQTKQQS